MPECFRFGFYLDAGDLPLSTAVRARNSQLLARAHADDPAALLADLTADVNYFPAL